ncbi:MAG TPA: helix-turn-helix transcriptional regulator [Blastocatellia bacterium]|nr:helix-turn-helix transcriptional regulator [Blastocatellia bacterium]
MQERKAAWLATQRDISAADVRRGQEIVNKAQKKRLEAAGWKFGTVQEFLGLSDAEAALIELRLILAAHLKKIRQKHKVTQMALAKAIGSSQPRVAKIEAGDPSVSLDLLIKASFAAGATRKDLATAIAAGAKTRRP